ncbi:MAG: 16S rRNA (adenine(1518)-N(6)/adenine(1519)-N(6))-dimethyltransferase RsmA [Thermosynechococcaceae cyanobacterium]
MPNPRKRFGQHWLKSQAVLEKIVAAAELKECDRILEIGPGTGILTQKLLPLAEAVTAVEIDRDLCKLLVRKFRDTDNFLLLQDSILSLNLNAVLSHYPSFANPNKIVANIPYNITGPILDLVLGSLAQPREPAFESIVLLLQQEVAQRLTAQSGSKVFGAMSVRTQYLATCDYICHVPSTAFKPRPKVDSAVVRLCPRPYPSQTDNPRWFETLVKLGFSSRRKMLRNNFKSVVDRDQLAVILEQLGVSSQARAEDLSVDRWVALSNRLQPA